MNIDPIAVDVSRRMIEEAERRCAGLEALMHGAGAGNGHTLDETLLGIAARSLEVTEDELVAQARMTREG